MDEDNSSLPSQINEAAKNATKNLLPTISNNKYEAEYKKFIEWKKSNNTNATNEKVMLAYFEHLDKKFKPSTLWTIYSILKSTINIHENINIKQYNILIAYLRRKSSGFQSKKSKILSSENVDRFLKEAPDDHYLSTKVVCIFGVLGACRTEELLNVKIQDIRLEGNLLVVNIPKTKTKKPRTFVISDQYTGIVNKYRNLRPAHVKTDRFFLKCINNRCSIQPIGYNTFSKMPKEIARYLQLEDADKYTGHAFRRTSATILVNAGADLLTLKRHGGWKSSSVAEGYVEDSVKQKENVANLISTAITHIPSTSTSREIFSDNTNFQNQNTVNDSNKNVSNIVMNADAHKIVSQDEKSIYNNCSITINNYNSIGSQTKPT